MRLDRYSVVDSVIKCSFLYSNSMCSGCSGFWHRVSHKIRMANGTAHRTARISDSNRVAMNRNDWRWSFLLLLAVATAHTHKHTHTQHRRKKYERHCLNRQFIWFGYFGHSSSTMEYGMKMNADTMSFWFFLYKFLLCIWIQQRQQHKFI